MNVIVVREASPYQNSCWSGPSRPRGKMAQDLMTAFKPRRSPMTASPWTVTPVTKFVVPRLTSFPCSYLDKCLSVLAITVEITFEEPRRQRAIGWRMEGRRGLGSGKVSTHVVKGACDGGLGLCTRVAAECDIKRAQVQAGGDEPQGLPLHVRASAVISSCGNNWLEVISHNVADKVVGKEFVVCDAAEGVVTIGIMGCPVPAAWEGGQVIDAELELAAKGTGEDRVGEVVTGCASYDRDQRVRGLNTEEAWDVLEVVRHSL